nr:hypothetical protein GCM10020093_030230 [Planobispora longispora]
MALGFAREHNGLDACSPGGANTIGNDSTGGAAVEPGRLAVLEGDPPGADLIRSGPRTGVASGKETPWRFWIDGDPTVSPYRPHVPRRRTS